MQSSSSMILIGISNRVVLQHWHVHVKHPGQRDLCMQVAAFFTAHVHSHVPHLRWLAFASAAATAAQQQVCSSNSSDLNPTASMSSCLQLYWLLAAGSAGR
jgi:hypothetical protein